MIRTAFWISVRLPRHCHQGLQKVTSNRLQRAIFRPKEFVHTCQALFANQDQQATQESESRSRGASKREAAKSVELALQLIDLSSKQLPRLEGILPEDIHDEVIIAQKISKTTQARKRQVNAVAKLLRQLDETELQQIQAVSTPAYKSPSDQKRDRMVDTWLAGLLADDKTLPSRQWSRR